MVILPKLQFSKERYSITISKDLVASKGWKKGQRIAMGFDANGDIVMKEVIE